MSDQTNFPKANSQTTQHVRVLANVPTFLQPRSAQRSDRRQTVETAPVRLDSKPRCESYQFRANPPITGNFDTIAKVKPLTALKSVNLTVFYSSVL